MSEEQLNIEYIREKTGLVENDELIPIILKMIKDSYKAGLCQAEYDNTMDLIEENKQLKEQLQQKEEEIKELCKKIKVNEKSRRKMQKSLMEKIQEIEKARKEAIEFIKEYEKNQNLLKWNEEDYIDVINEIKKYLDIDKGE